MGTIRQRILAFREKLQSDPKLAAEARGNSESEDAKDALKLPN